MNIPLNSPAETPHALLCRLGRWMLVGWLATVSGGQVRCAQPGPATNQVAGVPRKSLPDALSPAKWRQMEESVDRALAWLVAQQQADGSFSTAASGQPAVTSLGVMALLSRGHQPGAGPYGEQINRAIDFVLSCQLEDGLFCQIVPGPVWICRQPSHTALYNHAIAGLMLGDVYGQVTGEQAKRIKTAIEKALVFTRQMQTRSKPANDQGGWRYMRLEIPTDSDLSVTAWQLMFLRSAQKRGISGASAANRGSHGVRAPVLGPGARDVRLWVRLPRGLWARRRPLFGQPRLDGSRDSLAVNGRPASNPDGAGGGQLAAGTSLPQARRSTSGVTTCLSTAPIIAARRRRNWADVIGNRSFPGSWRSCSATNHAMAHGCRSRAWPCTGVN